MKKLIDHKVYKFDINLKNILASLGKRKVMHRLKDADKQLRLFLQTTSAGT